MKIKTHGDTVSIEMDAKTFGFVGSVFGAKEQLLERISKMYDDEIVKVFMKYEEMENIMSK